MIFCQACGGENTDDARFCNKCGKQIAKAGEAGGPLPPAAASGSSGGPPSGNTSGNTMSGGTVTLAGIGIASPRKTYAILAAGAALFLVLGAGLAWVAMRSGPTPVAESGDGGDEGEVEIGDAIPEGVDVPGGEFVTSGPRVVPPGTSGGTSGATATTTPSTTPRTPSTPRDTAPTRPRTDPPTRPTTPTTSGGTGTTDPTTPATPSTPGTPSTTPTTPGTPSTTPTTPGTPRDWDGMEEGVQGEEPDYEMEHYATTVRRFIRTYYLQRATSCFEHESATRRDTVRGTVVIGFQITLHGQTEHVTIDRNTTGADTLGTCLRNQVDAWELPSPPPDAAPLPMQMPFSR